MWVINWQCAHRRCAPLGGLKACPLGTFEILDAFSCNLVHFFSPTIFLFFYLYSGDEGGGACAPPGSVPVTGLSNPVFSIEANVYIFENIYIEENSKLMGENNKFCAARVSCIIMESYGKGLVVLRL